MPSRVEDGFSCYLLNRAVTLICPRAITQSVGDLRAITWSIQDLRAVTSQGGFNVRHSKSLLWRDKKLGAYTRVTSTFVWNLYSRDKSILNIHWKDWCWSSNTLGQYWRGELTHLKRPCCWERLKAGGEGDDRLSWFDGITSSMDMSLSKLQEFVWTGKPGVLQFMGSQRVGHD